MIVSMKDVILSGVWIIPVTYAEINGSKTVCGGSDVDFFFGINESTDLHILLIKHNSKEIGRYSIDNGIEVYPEFMDRYLIVKNKISIQLHINDVTLDDNGTVSCKVICKTKEVKYEYSLIIQERLTSSVIALKIKTGDTCTVLTCRANSNLLVLKKPDNVSIIGKHIVLDSCHHYFPTGEFSCCLITNCSETECSKITLEDSERVAADSSNIFFTTVSGTTIVIFVILLIIILVCKTRLNKKRKRQRYKSDQNQEHGTGVSTASKKTEFSEPMLYKSPETSEDSGIVTTSASIEMSD